MSTTKYSMQPKEEPPNPPASYSVLPKPPPANVPDVKMFRLTCITQMQHELEQDLAKYSKTKRRYSSAFNTLAYINAGSTTVAGVSAATGVGLLATGVGTPLALPFGVVSLCLELCSLVFSCANKKIKTKLQKHTAIAQLVTAKLSSFRLIISKALTDSNITDDEFNRLQADYDDYKRQKWDQQKRSITAFSQPQDVKAINKECLEKVNSTLKSILKT